MRRALVTAATAGLLATGTVAAHAAWADTGTAASGQLAARTLAAPAVSSCVVTGNALTGYTATITWPAATAPTTLTYTGALVELGNAPLTVSAAGGDRQVAVSSTFLAALLGADVTVRLRGALGGTAWTTGATDQRLRVGALATSPLTCL